MAWRAKAGREQKVLASIVSRLFSLADLAEGAVLRSPWVRWCILWAAWQANALLRDYVEGRAGNMAARRWSPVPMPAGFGSHPDDADDLAASLRALALVVRAIAAQVGRVAFLQRGDGSDEAGNEGASRLNGLPRLLDAAASAVEVRDTS
jgi:predicted dienelactone hydrolase